MAKTTLEQVKNLISRHPMGPEGFAPLLTGLNPDGSRFELTVERFGDNEVAFDRSLAFAAGAPINTPVDADMPPPDRLDPEARYAVIVHNPGAVAVTVRLFNRELLNGADRLSQVAVIGVPAGGVAAVQQIVQGLYVGSGASLVRISNDSAVPAGGGFSVGVRVRRP